MKTGNPTFSTLERESKTNRYPLSFSQQRLWFLDQFISNRAVYNVSYAFYLRGNLDSIVLIDSLKQIVHRYHPGLRMSFFEQNGKVFQKISENQLHIEQMDYRDLPGERKEAEVLQVMKKDACVPFDLGNDLLIRGKLFLLEDQYSILYLNFHHIVFDGWSIPLLINTLDQCYQRKGNEVSTDLPHNPALHYGDYASWQQKIESPNSFQPKLEYWKTQLKEKWEPLTFPTDFSRPSISSYQGALYRFHIDPSVTSQLKDLAQQKEVTLYILLLAVFQILIFRYTGQELILVGTPTANRNSQEFENIIGCFVNTLVLQGNLSGNPSFSEFLTRVKEATSSAFIQEVPFEKLIEALDCEKGSSSLVQVTFQFIPVVNVELADLQIQMSEIDNGGAKFDLSLHVFEKNQSLEGLFEYSLDLFKKETIKRIVGCFTTLIQGILNDPQELIQKIPLLDAQEKDQILIHWNDTAFGFPSHHRIHDLLEEQVQKTPQQIALLYNRKRITYTELNQRANQLAHFLRSQGVRKDGLIGLFTERSFEMVIGVWGILKSGGAYVPFDPDYPHSRLEYMMDDSGCHLILTQSHLKPFIPHGSHQIICLDDEKNQKLLKKLPDSNIRQSSKKFGEHDLAYVIYTSGSTGEPKGVAVEHQALVNRIHWMQHRYSLNEKDRILQKTPFSFDVSVWELIWPFIAGASLVLAKPEGHKDPFYLADLIQHYNITILHFVPSMLSEMVASVNWQVCHSVKRVFCSGEALSSELIERFFRTGTKAQLHNLYGPTEAAIDVTYWDVEQNFTGTIVPIGKPIHNVQLYVLDDQLTPVQIGVPGELYIGGICLARGYLNRPELTNNRFIPNPFYSPSNASKRLYKTGDLVRYRSDGNIEFLGRQDHQVKIQGCRIELKEIEFVLTYQVKEIREAIVHSLEVTPGNPKLVIYCVFYPNQVLTLTQLRDILKNHLPDYMIPHAFVPLEKIPLTLNGKVDYKSLPDLKGHQLSSEKEFIVPTTELEKVLAGVFCDLLEIEKIGIHDNFFELGGHSLLAIKLSYYLREIFNLNISIPHIFEYPTISLLIKRICEHPDFERIERTASILLDLTLIE